MSRIGVRAGAIAVAGGAILGIGPAHALLGGPASASAAVGMGMALVPDPVFSGAQTTQQKTELKAWGQAYWNRIEGVNPGGSTSSTAAWTFSTPAMNSPLFNPFYGPRQAMVKLGLAGKDDCLKDLAEGSGTDASSVSKRGALKDAQVNFKFATDPVTDPVGTTNHILQILDASTVSDLVTYTASGKIISENLPLEVLVQAGASADLADTLSENSITALLALTSQAPAIVANATGATEAQAMVGGQATKANAVAAGIVALLNQAGIAGATVERMDAIFGVYGQLPTVYVALSDCAVLIDATTGAATAPIKLHTQLDASGLLLLHPEAAESPFAHRMMSAGGCGVVVAIAPTPGPTPAGPVPHTGPPLAPSALVPAVPATPTTPGTPPGRPTNYVCADNPGVSITSCNCDRIIHYQNPPVAPATTPTFFDVRQVCKNAGVWCTNSGGPVGTACEWFY